MTVGPSFTEHLELPITVTQLPDTLIQHNHFTPVYWYPFPTTHNSQPTAPIPPHPTLPTLRQSINPSISHLNIATPPTPLNPMKSLHKPPTKPPQPLPEQENNKPYRQGGLGHGGNSVYFHRVHVPRRQMDDGKVLHFTSLHFTSSHSVHKFSKQK
jgi:hypothetical protein